MQIICRCVRVRCRLNHENQVGMCPVINKSRGNTMFGTGKTVIGHIYKCWRWPAGGISKDKSFWQRSMGFQWWTPPQCATQKLQKAFTTVAMTIVTAQISTLHACQTCSASLILCLYGPARALGQFLTFTDIGKEIGASLDIYGRWRWPRP
jgi:hypothetical protein